MKLITIILFAIISVLQSTVQSQSTTLEPKEDHWDSAATDCKQEGSKYHSTIESEIWNEEMNDGEEEVKKEEQQGEQKDDEKDEEDVEEKIRKAKVDQDKIKAMRQLEADALAEHEETQLSAVYGGYDSEKSVMIKAFFRDDIEEILR